MFWEILIGELSSWIQMSFKHYAMQEAKQQFLEYDKNSDGSVSWDEYNIQMYDRVIDFDENTALDDAEEESFRQVSMCAQAFSFDHISSVSCMSEHKKPEVIDWLPCSLGNHLFHLSGHFDVSFLARFSALILDYFNYPCFFFLAASFVLISWFAFLVYFEYVSQYFILLCYWTVGFVSYWKIIEAYSHF